MYPSVNPILVQIGPLALHWYGITMTLAIFLGALIASRYVATKGQDSNNVWDMLLWVLIPALVGARLYFVFIQTPRSGPDGLPAYLANPVRILEVWQGGIHIYGAFIFGGIALLLYVRQRKLPPLIYLDGVGLGLLLGQAIGRIGNFINQELYGPPTTLPWGLRIDAAHRIGPYIDLTQYPDTVRFQPLFLYELVWDFIGFCILFWIARRFAKYLRNGDLFLLYLIWAPLGRFFIEFMRTDSWFFPGTPFNPVHLLTACAVIGASIILYLRLRNRQPFAVAEEAKEGESAITAEASPIEEVDSESIETETEEGEPAENEEEVEVERKVIEIETKSKKIEKENKEKDEEEKTTEVGSVGTES